MEARARRVVDRLAREGLDGWLFLNHGGADPALAGLFPVRLPAHFSRRALYCVSTQGEAVRVVSSVEPHALDGLPGVAWVYHSGAQWEQALATLAGNHRRVAVQWSPAGRFPAIDRLPAGFAERLRALGLDLVSSAGLLADLAVLDPDELAAHESAARALTGAVERAFAHLRTEFAAGRPVTETGVQTELRRLLADAGLDAPDGPIVAFGEHTADPHFAPSRAADAAARLGELVLIDAWARRPEPGAPYADLTWMGVLEEEVPHEAGAAFDVVARARDSGFEMIQRAARAGRPLAGANVDELVRGCLEADGYLDYFLHRTGHSLGAEVHGTGVNLDSHETVDDRTLVPGSVFTIEPGLYFPGRFGVRSEIDVLLTADDARVTTVPLQTSLLPILG